MSDRQNDVVKGHRRYYAFGSYVLDSLRGVLWHDGHPVPLTPKVFELLATLVSRSGELLGKDELIREVWAGTVVEENNLARHISTIRKTLGERPGQRDYIATIPGMGYRFVAEVTELDELPPECRSAAVVKPSNGLPVAEQIPSVPVSLPRRVPTVPRSLWIGSLVVVAVAVGAAASWVTTGGLWPARPVPPAERSLKQFTYESGLQLDPAWSPDGTRIAYGSNRLGNADIWIQAIGESTPPLRLTTSASNDWQPTWSPDGKSLAFRSERDGGGVYVISVDGSGERRLTTFGTHPRWSPTGDVILFSRADPETSEATRLCLVDARGGGSPREIALADLSGFNAVTAAWHPDGRVSVWGRGERNEWTLATFAIDGGPVVRSAIGREVRRQMAAAGVSFSNFTWSPSGRALYFEGRSNSVRNLWRVTVNPRTLAWADRLERMTTGPGRNTGLSISPDGRRLAFNVGTPRVTLWSFGFDANASKITDNGEDVTPGDADQQAVEASLDGRRLVYRALRSDRSELWERSGDSDPRLLMSTNEWRYSLPRWSPDGTRVAYQRTRNASTGVKAERAISILAVADRQERSLAVPDNAMMVPGDWQADGLALLGGCRLAANPTMGTCLMPIDGREVRQLAYDDHGDQFQQRFSPNQQWISFMAIPVGDRSSTTVYVMPAKGGARIAMTDGGSFDDKPRWGPDGRTLYFTSNRGGRSEVWARRFDPASGVPVGEVFRVTSFDRGPRMLAPALDQASMALSTNRIYLPMYEPSGHIWILDEVDK